MTVVAGRQNQEGETKGTSRGALSGMNDNMLGWAVAEAA